MNKMNIKWIIISLILIAPYIELARLLIDNYPQFRDFKLPGLHSFGPSPKLNASDLYTALFNLKYFLLLYGVGLVVGVRYLLRLAIIVLFWPKLIATII